MTEWEYKPKPQPKEPEMVDPQRAIFELFTRLRKKKPKPENPPQQPPVK